MFLFAIRAGCDRVFDKIFRHGCQGVFPRLQKNIMGFFCENLTFTFFWSSSTKILDFFGFREKNFGKRHGFEKMEFSKFFLDIERKYFRVFGENWSVWSSNLIFASLEEQNGEIFHRNLEFLKFCCFRPGCQICLQRVQRNILGKNPRKSVLSVYLGAVWAKCWVVGKQIGGLIKSALHELKEKFCLKFIFLRSKLQNFLFFERNFYWLPMNFSATAFRSACTYPKEYFDDKFQSYLIIYTFFRTSSINIANF